MKKTLLLSLTFGIGMGFLSHAYAFAEEADDRVGTRVHQISVQQKLNEAIQRRWKNDFMKHEYRNDVVKTRPFKLQQHNLNSLEGNVNERSTQMDRSGEFETIPDYANRQQYDDPSMIRKNQTQIFKARAVDYYVEGGDAGTEALRSNVILGSEHRVPRNFVRWATADPAVLRDIRAVQRSLYTPPKVGAAQQLMRALQKGDYFRNLTHPFMFGTEEEEKIEEFGSTEAE